MSTYQYYEFLAIDRPLDDDQRAQVRSLSTRARITATSFVNEYHWGDFSGDPNKMMERYYDAHLHLASWGSHRLMLRLPREAFDMESVEEYRVDQQVEARITREHVILDFTSEDESGDYEGDAGAMLSAMVGVRAELASGDHRPLYLAWLAAFGAWERDDTAFHDDADDDLEPPVPPGLGSLSAAQRAMADFLRLEADLLAVAAQASPSLPSGANDSRLLTRLVAELPTAEKERLLQRVAGGQGIQVQQELQRRARQHHVPSPGSESPRRTVAELLDAAARIRSDRARRQAVERAAAEAKRKAARAFAKERRLDELSRSRDAAWSSVESLIETRRPKEYDAAVALLGELRSLAERDEAADEFAVRMDSIRHRYARRPSLIERLDSADI